MEEREEEVCWVCDSVGVVEEREPCVRQGGLDCVWRDLRGPTKESRAQGWAGASRAPAQCRALQLSCTLLSDASVPLLALLSMETALPFTIP